MRLQATLTLPSYIPVDKSVMGAEFQMIIGDYTGIIAFPALQEKFQEVITFEKEGLSDTHLLPPPNADVTLFEYEVDWGRQCTSEGIALIKHCVVWFDLDESHDYGNFSDIFNNNISSWLDQFILFLEILERQIFNSKDGQDRKVDVRFLMNDNSMIHSPRMQKISIKIVFQTNGIQTDNIKKAITLANKGKEPNIEKTFVRNANFYLRKKNYRVSVLDSASAVEIALTKKIINCLEQDLKNPELIQNILKKNENINGRLDLSLLLQIPLPFGKNEYNEKIAKFRNRVIHAGYSPSSIEARNAYEVALQTVNSLYDDLDY